jgi:hypothetical protein
MARKTAAQAAEKWGRKMAAAGQDYAAGINAVTEAPGIAAAKNAQGYINGVQASMQKWQTNTANVPLETWRDAALTKGAQRLAAGAAAAVPKVQAAHERILPMVDRARASIAGMDRSTPMARIERSAAYQRAMHEQANGTRRGR